MCIVKDGLFNLCIVFLKDGKDENGVLTREKLDIAFPTKKLSLRKAGSQIHDGIYQIIDVIGTIINNLPNEPQKNENSYSQWNNLL